MSFAIDPKKTGSINDGGRNLKIGTFAYKIVSADYVAKKSDPSGKSKQVVLGAQSISDPNYTCKVYLDVNSDNEATARIAAQTLVAITAAAGIAGIIKPETLKKLLKKTVVIEAVETAGKGTNKGKTFVNVRTIEEFDPDTYSEGEEEEAEEEEEEETEEEEAEEEEEEAEEEEEEEAEEEEEEEQEEEEEEEQPKKKVTKPAAKPSTKTSTKPAAGKAPAKTRPW